MNNINDSYFDGQYKEIWRSLIPTELTVKETEFILQYFKLEPGNKVLDLMCGYGRHALALGKKGIAVTAVDNLDAYISEIKKEAEKENLPVEAIKTDVLKYKTDDRYDLALCMGNSLNFFNPEDTQNLLVNIHSHLKPRGGLLINTWSLAEIAIKNFATKAWSETGGVKHICESKYLFHPTRIESHSIFLSADGHIEKKEALDYIFSVGEMEAMLDKTGFALKEIYSIPGRKKFTLGEPRAYIVAEKI
jgi:SAM-dependent methyltransferase